MPWRKNGGTTSEKNAIRYSRSHISSRRLALGSSFVAGYVIRGLAAKNESVLTLPAKDSV